MITLLVEVSTISANAVAVVVEVLADGIPRKELQNGVAFFAFRSVTITLTALQTSPARASRFAALA